MLLKRLALFFAFLEIFLLSPLALCKNAIPKVNFKISGRHLAFSSENEKAIYEDTRRYIPRNVVATRMQLYRQKLIVALPRYMPGVPITLAKADLMLKNSQQMLRAFPDWKMQQIGNCDALQSVVDIFIDRKNVLWILDTGTLNLLEKPINKCSPKVVAYCLKKMKILQSIDLSYFVTNSTNLQYIVVDNAFSGNSYLYISDAGGQSILVINSSNGIGRKLQLPTVVTAGGVCNNVLYLAMLRYQGVNHLYFTYLDCEGIFSIPTLSLTDVKELTFIHLVGIKSDPMVFCGTDGDNVLYYRLKDKGDIYSWDVNTVFSPDRKAVVRRGVDGRITTHITTGPGGLPWAMETNIRDYISNCTGCFGTSTIIFPLTKVLNKH